MSSLQLKYKKLKYELKYLELEVEETEDKFRECINNFEKAFREKMGDDFEDPNKDKGVKLNQKKQEEIKNDKQSSEVKKVYRKIVSKTHPDKLEQLPNNTIKKKLIKHYKKAVEHYNNNNVVGLFDLADELDIKLPEIDESYIEKMSMEVNSLRGKIKRYKDSNAWIWHHSTGEMAENIMNQIVSKL